MISRLVLLRKALVASAPYFLLAVFASAPALYLGWNHEVWLGSPDETVAYKVAQTFADSGRLYFRDAVTELDPQEPAAMRGFIQHNGRTVPVYPLGYLFALGVAHRIFGGMAPFVLAIMPAALYVAWLLSCRVVMPKASPYLGLSLLSIGPVWYWSSRVYFGMGWSALFLAIGVFFCLLAARRSHLGWFFAGSANLALAALMRHQEAPLLLLLAFALIVMYVGFCRATKARILVVLGLYAGAQLAFFLVPMAVLNWATYGSPLSIGFSLHAREFWPDRVPDPTGNALVSAIGFVKTAFFPAPLGRDALWMGIVYRLVFLVPLPLLLALAGAFLAKRQLQKVFGWGGLLLLCVTLAYVLISRAFPDTWNALMPKADLDASIVRYWMPLYMALGLGLVYALAHVGRPVAVAMVLVLLTMGVYQVWQGGSANPILRLPEQLREQGGYYERVIEDTTEPDALVFAGSWSDRWIAPMRRVILWTESPGPNGLGQIPRLEGIRRTASTAMSAYRRGMPVYFFGDRSYDLNALTEQLQGDFLGLKLVSVTSKGHRLWKVVSQPRRLETQPAGEGMFVAHMLVPGGRYAIYLENDGTVRNHVRNPSFEDGLGHWSAPVNFGERVSRSSAFAKFGNFSLRLEQVPQENVPTRQNYIVDAKSLRADTFSVRGWVFVERLDGARAQLNIMTETGEGRGIDRYEVVVSEATETFRPVVIQELPLPPVVGRIVIQLVIIPQGQGASGVVYWDGIELVDGPLPERYGDGDQPGWSWLGRPHSSTSERKGGVEAIVLGEEAITLGGPFETGDRLVIDGDQINLERDGVQRLLGRFSQPLRQGEELTIWIEASYAPVLRLLPLDW